MPTFQSSLSVVIDNLVISLLEELNGGESLDLNHLYLVGGGIHLCNHDVLIILNIKQVIRRVINKW